MFLQFWNKEPFPNFDCKGFVRTFVDTEPSVYTEADDSLIASKNFQIGKQKMFSVIFIVFHKKIMFQCVKESYLWVIHTQFIPYGTNVYRQALKLALK